MRHRLILVEGPPCSGKSTVSARIAAALADTARVRFVDEGTGNHPADWEYHALAPAGLGLEHYIAADPQRDWAAAEADILAFLKGATA